MSYVQWNPFRELSVFRTPVGRAFRPVGSVTEDRAESSWAPAVDVYETEDHALVVNADLSGVDQKDVSVTLEDGTLTIAGERKFESAGDKGRVYRTERAYGSFRRSFSVPSTVDGDSVTAEHKDGTLRVTLPQREDAKPQRITVKAA